MIRTVLILSIAYLALYFSGDAHAQDRISLSGTVIDQLTQEPIPNALVVIDEAEIRVVTDPFGHFRVPLPGVGVYRVRASAPHYEASAWRVVTVAAGDTQLELEIEIEPRIYRVPTVEIYHHRSRSDLPLPPTKALLASDIRRAPGGFQDPLRALQESRAIESRNDLGTLLTIRGGEPDQVLFLVDGFDVYNPYRLRILLGGGLSLANPDIIESVELHAGGFSARYGNRTSGLIHMRTRAGNRSEFRSRYNLSLVAASTAFEGPFNGGRGSWIVGLRRTYYDLILRPPKGDGTQYPYLQEAQARVDWEATSNQTLVLRASGSDEGIDLITRGEGTAEDVQADGGSNTMSASIEHIVRATSNARARTRFAILSDRSRIKLLGIKGESTYADVETEALRFSSAHEWEIDAPPHVARVGFAWDRYWSLIDWGSDTEASPTINPVPDSLAIDEALTYRAAYVEDVVALRLGWFVSLGVRFEDASGASPMQLSPRFALKGELPYDLRMRIGAGQFLQYPDGAQSFSREAPLWLEKLSELPPERATMFSFGLGGDLERFGWDVEAYTRDTESLLVPENREDYSARPTGRALAKGVEVELRLKPAPRDGRERSYLDQVGLHLSHAWSHSRFKGEIFESQTPVATDREHSFLGRLELPLSESYRLSWVLRLATGNPFTPLLGRVAWWDAEGDVHYHGIWDEANSGRTSPYGRLDLRLDREVELFGRRGVVFLEILNITNRANTLSIVWDDDNEKRSPVRGLPILPFIGLSF